MITALRQVVMSTSKGRMDWLVIWEDRNACYFRIYVILGFPIIAGLPNNIWVILILASPMLDVTAFIYNLHLYFHENGVPEIDSV